MPTPCKDCPDCLPGLLPILFVRYAVAYCTDPQGESALRSLLPARDFKPAPATLETSHHVLRMLREGVLYVLTSTAGLKSWTGYLIHAHGYLTSFHPETTPLPAAVSRPSCQPRLWASNKSVVWVKAPKNTTDLWYFFSPDFVTPARLATLKADPARLQHLDPAAWLNGSRSQPHTCLPEALPKRVAEWPALVNAALVNALNEQTFGLMGMTSTQRGYGVNDMGQPPYCYISKQRFDDAMHWPAPRVYGLPDDAHWFALTGSEASAHSPGMGKVVSPVKPERTYASVHGQRLDALLQTLQGDSTAPATLGIVAAVHDGIGIAQELNNWRNAGMQALARFNEGPAGRERDVVFYVGQLRRLLDEKAVTQVNRTATAQLATADPAPYRSPEARRAEVDKRLSSFKAKHKEDWHREAEAAFDKCIDGLDRPAMEIFPATYLKIATALTAPAIQREPDHLAYLKSVELQEAFAFYDDKDVASGLGFASQLGKVFMGLSATPKGEALLLQWAEKMEPSPDHWIVRGFLLNQADAIASFDAAMGASDTEFNAPVWQERTKVQVDLFDKTMALIEEAQSLRQLGQVRSSYFKLEGVALFLTNTNRMFGQALFKTAAIGTGWTSIVLARKVATMMAMWNGSNPTLHGLFDRLGRVQVVPKSGLINQLAGALPSEAPKGQIEALLKSTVENARGGEFWKLHLGATIAMLEAWNLSMKARAAGGIRSREQLELAAASLATMSASLEMGAILAEWAAKKSVGNQALVEIWELRLGGYRLAGGMLAGVAGIAGAYFDFMDAGKARDEGKLLLTRTLLGRGIATGFGVLSSGALSFSFTGPVWKALAERFGDSMLGTTASAVGDVAEFAIQFRSKLIAWNWIAIGVTVALTTVKLALDESALEAYCKRSVFRNAKFNTADNPLFSTAAEELGALLKGIKEATE